VIGYDATNLDNFAGLLDADVLFGYVDGAWATWAELRALTEWLPVHVVSIAVFAEDDADILDVEPGDATNIQAPSWVRRQIKRGVWRPGVYTSVSNVDTLVDTLAAGGLNRADYRIWSAHYGIGEHLCGPSTCGQAHTAADGTQWTDQAHGRSLDQSLLAASFFPPTHPASGALMAQPGLLTPGPGPTPIAVPNGAKRLRFYSNEDAELRVDRTGTAPSVTITVGYDNPQGVDLTAVLGVVVHRVDSGLNDVSYVISA
jgi:hypothetical protein